MSRYLRAIYRIEASPDGPRRARGLVEQELRHELPESALEDVKLLVSELVTNGIIHGSRRPGEVITIEVVINGTVRCTVRDHGQEFAASQRPDRVGGWGLSLVEQLAARWGLVHSSGGTSVWFEPQELPRSSSRRKRGDT